MVYTVYQMSLPHIGLNITYSILRPHFTGPKWVKFIKWRVLNSCESVIAVTHILISPYIDTPRRQRLSRKNSIHFVKMTSSNENIFRVTGHLCGQLTGHRWIPHTKASDAELWCFLWSGSWINGWVSNGEAGDLRRHCAHYDVIVMVLKLSRGYSYGILCGSDPPWSIIKCMLYILSKPNSYLHHIHIW